MNAKKDPVKGGGVVCTKKAGEKQQVTGKPQAVAAKPADKPKDAKPELAGAGPDKAGDVKGQGQDKKTQEAIGSVSPVAPEGKDKPKAKVSRKAELVVTPAMEKAIVEAKQDIKDGMNKAEAAREAYDALKGHQRKQVIHVFMVGVGLSKAGAGTYYQNCKK